MVHKALFPAGGTLWGGVGWLAIRDFMGGLEDLLF